MEIVHEEVEKRFLAFINTVPAGFIAYEKEGSLLRVTHTNVEGAFRGQGLAGVLTRHLLAYARRHAWKVRPECSYVRQFLEQHREYDDLAEASPSMYPLLPLEDEFVDVLAKVCRGLGLSSEEVCLKTGLDRTEWRELRAGRGTPEQVLTVARAFHLSGEPLLALWKGERQTMPQPRLEGLAMFTSQWHDMMVNHFLVWEEQTGQAALFDTGAESGETLAFLREHGLELAFIAITHTHRDHIQTLPDWRELHPGIPVHIPEGEPSAGIDSTPVREGQTLQLGHLCIHALGTSGHAVAGLSYFVEGLKRPLAIVGDAIFAASMGGPAVSYQDALRKNIDKLLTLPENTLLACGHGPLTTVGEERCQNPFFPIQSK